jgi:hypothetical protein
MVMAAVGLLRERPGPAGVRVRDLPLTRERVARAIEES